MKRLIAAALALCTVTTIGVVVLTSAVAASSTTTDCDTDGAPSPNAQSGPALAATAAYSAGFRGQDLVMAVAIAGAESSYRPTVRNSLGASGLWQILQSAHPELFARYDWGDPVENAVMARSVWVAARRSWTPWTTFTGGAYRSHLAEAQEAVATVVAISPRPATPLANAAGASRVSISETTPQAAAGSDASSSPVCPPAAGGLPPAPRPFVGPDGYVDDPTGSGQITRRMLHTYTEVNRAFGGHWPWGIGCWDPHAWNPTSDHPKGKACDFAVGRIGRRPTAEERSTGWQLAFWLQRNARSLGVTYVIWDRRIWSLARTRDGWRIYDGGGVYDSASITGGHMDHVHCSTQ